MSVQELTIEQQRELFQRRIQGYRLAEALTWRNWRPPTTVEKLRFDRFMQDALRHCGTTPRDCGMVNWYASLMRDKADNLTSVPKLESIRDDLEQRLK